MSENRQDEIGDERPADYDPPKVETVLTDEDLAREIQYAGITVLPG